MLIKVSQDNVNKFFDEIINNLYDYNIKDFNFKYKNQYKTIDDIHLIYNNLDLKKFAKDYLEHLKENLFVKNKKQFKKNFIQSKIVRHEDIINKYEPNVIKNNRNIRFNDAEVFRTLEKNLKLFEQIPSHLSLNNAINEFARLFPELKNKQKFQFAWQFYLIKELNHYIFTIIIDEEILHKEQSMMETYMEIISKWYEDGIILSDKDDE